MQILIVDVFGRKLLIRSVNNNTYLGRLQILSRGHGLGSLTDMYPSLLYSPSSLIFLMEKFSRQLSTHGSRIFLRLRVLSRSSDVS